MLVNASRRFEKGRPKNYLPEDVPETVADLFNRGEAIDGEVLIITCEQAVEADFNLSPSRWISQGSDAQPKSIPQLVRSLEELAAIESDTTASLLRLLRPLAEEGVSHE